MKEVRVDYSHEHDVRIKTNLKYGEYKQSDKSSFRKNERR